MPKLRRLNGKDVLDILIRLGFTVMRVKGSHHRLRRDGCFIVIPVHGSAPLNVKTLASIYRQARACVPEDELRPLFYTD